MVSARGQLPLRFAEGRVADFESFWPGANAEAVAAVTAAVSGQPGSIYLSGPGATGKSHLLQAACRRAADLGTAAALIPVAELASYGPRVLEDLQSMSVICLDDLHIVAGDQDWEYAIFALFNRCRELGRTLLMTGSTGPGGLGISLQDLVSRLEWGLAFQLKPLNDGDKLLALQRRAETRGFTLADDVGRFMLARLPRDMGGLMAALDRLDELSLVRKRRLTVPLVRDLLRGEDG